MIKQTLALALSASLLVSGTMASAQSLSGPHKYATQSAERWLRLVPQSKKGLIETLSGPYGEGYSVEVATQVVNNLDVQWHHQAALSAERWLRLVPHSCQGLIETLSGPYGEGFTKEEATYGAHQTDAC